MEDALKKPMRELLALCRALRITTNQLETVGIVLDSLDDDWDSQYKTEEQAKIIKMNRFFALKGYGMLRYLCTEVCSNPNQGMKDVTALIHAYRGWE